MAFDDHLATNVRAALTGAGAVREVERGRTMESYIYVAPSALDDQWLRKSMRLAVGFVQTLSPKTRQSKPKQTKGRRK